MHAFPFTMARIIQVVIKYLTIFITVKDQIGKLVHNLTPLAKFSCYVVSFKIQCKLLLYIFGRTITASHREKNYIFDFFLCY